MDKKRGWIEWDRYDHLFPVYNSKELAEMIGCSPSSVKQRRKKLKIPSPGRWLVEINDALAEHGRRWCTSCRKVKDLEAEFGARSNRKFPATCKACVREKAKKYRRAPKFDRHKVRVKRKLGKKGPKIYKRMLREQEGKCAICKEHADQNLYIDHDHDTGEVRGLLCNTCNAGIGFLGDSIEQVRRALQYLESANERTDLPILR